MDKNDILFIDSSHVAKLNADVNYIFFEILPRLKKDVHIHFHDISYPFVYPKEWIYEGRAYNEMWLLQTFLMYNNAFSVCFFGEYITKKHIGHLRKNSKTIVPDLHGSIWLRKNI